MTTPEPFGGNYRKNAARVQEPAEPCAHCGRAVKAPGLGRRVIVVQGGARYGTPLDDENDPGHMGSFPVGPDCALKLECAGVWVG